MLFFWGLAIPFSNAFEIDSFLSSLPINQIIENNGGVYVRMREARKGKIQATENLLIFKGTILAGYWFCKYTPQPNEKLNVNLVGLNVVHSSESKNIFEVIVFFKNQKPICQIENLNSLNPLKDQNIEVNQPLPIPSKDTSQGPIDLDAKNATNNESSLKKDPTSNIKVQISPEEF
jgi:hypothetical protein